MSDIAISVSNLSKQYRIGGVQERYKTMRDMITTSLTAPAKRLASILRGDASGAAQLEETIWALSDVSFDIKQGEAVAIIGRNGSGKSTLLKILSRITEPTKGYAKVRGRVGSLLEVGTAFHQELTGRENVYLNGAILGMTRKELDRKFDEIVAFSEIEKFIDTPVKHYSSGMYLRLAFAVAAHLEPDILLLDEVLAVGDMAFQRKCLSKLGDVAKGGRTVLFVSHDMSAIRRFCKRGIVLNNGKNLYSGSVTDAIDFYLNSAATSSAFTQEGSDKPLHFLSARVLDNQNAERQRFAMGEPIKLEILVKAMKPLESSMVDVTIDYEAVPLFRSFDTDDHKELGVLREPGLYHYYLELDTQYFKPGRYSVHLTTSIQRRASFEYFSNALWFEVFDEEGDFDRSWSTQRAGVIRFPGKWVPVPESAGIPERISAPSTNGAKDTQKVGE